MRQFRLAFIIDSSMAAERLVLTRAGSWPFRLAAGGSAMLFRHPLEFRPTSPRLAEEQLVVLGDDETRESSNNLVSHALVESTCPVVE